MKINLSTLKNKQDFFFLILLSVLFACSLTQEPLFSSNQLFYLLKPISKVVGFPLSKDWLANTTDHLILFSHITEFLYSLSPNLLYFVHGFFTLILILSLCLISKKLGSNQFNKLSLSVFFILFFILEIIFGVLNLGNGGHYILGRFYQPSIFGILIIVSILFFTNKKYIISIFCLILSAYLNPTYIFQCAILVVAYQLILLKDKSLKYSLFIGCLAFVLIFPLVYYTYYTFLALPKDLLQKSQEILAYKRMGVAVLLNEFFYKPRFLICLGLVFLALIIYRKNRNIVILLMIPISITTIFVLFGYLTNNLTVILIIPQRSLAWLAPLALSLLIGRISTLIDYEKLFNTSKEIIIIFCIFSLIFLAQRGIGKTIKAHYLLKENKLHTFLRKLDYKVGSLLVPIDRAEIRMNAAVPVFVDFEGFSYKADDVIQWDNRIQLASNFYNSNSNMQKMLILKKIMNKEKISYILLDERTRKLDCDPIYKDEKSTVYDVNKCFDK
jgi:hypothetical protein